MLDYETLDTIADAYVPLLAFGLLVSTVLFILKKRWLNLLLLWGSFLFGVVIAYGGMFLDNWLNIWPSFGLDYSTHTAVALILNITLVVCWPKFLPGLFALFVAYILLMLYQQYHTISDILTTALCVGVIVIPVHFLFNDRFGDFFRKVHQNNS